MQLHNVLIMVLIVLCMNSCKTTKTYSQGIVNSSAVTKAVQVQQHTVTEQRSRLVSDSMISADIKISSIKELTSNTSLVVRDKANNPVATISKKDSSLLHFESLPGFSSTLSYEEFVSKYDMINKIDSNFNQKIIQETPKQTGIGSLKTWILFGSLWIIAVLVILSTDSKLRPRNNC